MQTVLPGVYIPTVAHLNCPFPMKPLHLYFALLWLHGGVRNLLRTTQEQAHANPPPSAWPPIKEVADYPELPAGLHLELRWLEHPKFGTILPNVIRVIGINHAVAQTESAQRVFSAAFNQLMLEHNYPQRYPRIQFNPFAVWHGFVQGRPVSQETATLERFIAEKEIVFLVMEDGEEAAYAAATSIVHAINDNFPSMGPS